MIVPNGEIFDTQFNNTLIRADQHVEQTPNLNRAWEERWTFLSCYLQH